MSDEDPQAITMGKVLTPIIIGIMVFALLLRFSQWNAAKHPIPPGGDPPLHNTRTGTANPGPYYDN